MTDFLSYIDSDDFKQFGFVKTIPGGYIIGEKDTDLFRKLEQTFTMPRSFVFRARDRDFYVLNGAGKTWPRPLPLVTIDDELFKLLSRPHCEKAVQ